MKAVDRVGIARVRASHFRIAVTRPMHAEGGRQKPWMVQRVTLWTKRQAGSLSYIAPWRVGVGTRYALA